jgi:hypothetical protein
MKNYIQEKKFSLNQFLTTAISVVALVGITVVCLCAPALDAFDKWTEQPKNQLILGAVTIGVLGAFGVKRLIKMLRG